MKKPPNHPVKCPVRGCKNHGPTRRSGYCDTHRAKWAAKKAA